MIYKGTVNEFMNKGLWDDYCEATGTSVWAVAEGLMADDEIIEFDTTEKTKILDAGATLDIERIVFD